MTINSDTTTVTISLVMKVQFMLIIAGVDPENERGVTMVRTSKESLECSGSEAIAIAIAS